MLSRQIGDDVAKGPQDAGGAWRGLLPRDPSPCLLEGEPAGRWLTLTALLGLPDDHPQVSAAREASLAAQSTQWLLAQLPDWERAQVIGGHDSPRFAPNLLLLLAKCGVRAGDDPRVEVLLDAMLRHQDDAGRFMTCGAWRGRSEPVWGSLPCDHHAIVEALLCFGRGRDERMAAALRRMEEDLQSTPQGSAWRCIPDPVTGFRGPGRKIDCCPQVTLEALRVFSYPEDGARPKMLADVVRTALSLWRRRGDEKPYMFGHGMRFKTVKWPATWYSVLAVLDAVGRYPDVWCGVAAEREDRRAVAEMAACLIAYNVGRDGLVTPRSCFRGFQTLSFGQKRQPSELATALVCEALARLAPLADEIAAVDVLSLGSSKGGTGHPMPPR